MKKLLLFFLFFSQSVFAEDYFIKVINDNPRYTAEIHYKICAILKNAKTEGCEDEPIEHATIPPRSHQTIQVEERYYYVKIMDAVMKDKEGAVKSSGNFAEGNCHGFDGIPLVLNDYDTSSISCDAHR